MRFFRNAARRTFKCASRENTSHAFSVLWSIFRGRAQKEVFEAAISMFQEKKIKRRLPMLLK